MGPPLDAESYRSDLSASVVFPVPGHTWTVPTRFSITQEVLKYQVLKIHATFPLKARAWTLQKVNMAPTTVSLLMLHPDGRKATTKHP